MLTCAAAQGGAQELTAKSAHDEIQRARGRAAALLRAGDSAGVTELESLLSRLREPQLRDLANGYPYLANRALNLEMDLARAGLARGDTAAAHQHFLRALNADPPPSSPLSEFDSTLTRLLTADEARSYDAAWRTRTGLRLATAFRSESFDVADRIAALSLLWAEVRWGFPNIERGAMPVWDSLYRAAIPRVIAAEAEWTAWQELQRLVAQLEDGHTNVYPPPALVDRHWARPPITTERVEGRVVIRAASAAARALGVEPGAIIETIDGELVDSYAAREIAPYVSSSTPQDREVRVYGYHLLRGPVDRDLRLGLASASAPRREVVVPRDTPRDATVGRAVRDSILPNGIGYLRIDHFEDERIAAMVQESLARLAGTQGLIVDLRRNGGGNSSLGFGLLRALADAPIVLPTSWIRTMPSFWKARGFHSLTMHLPADTLALDPTIDRYDAPVAFLVGPMTFSAAEDVTAMFQGMRRGAIVGLPTGGSTGQPYVFRLPGGGQARVRTKHDVAPGGVEFDGVGIAPDVIVPQTLDGIRAGQDEQLEAAVRHLEERRRGPRGEHDF
ncbi:MAG: S41 family peptidase [Gemmatimonadaceae bacterium]|nr:S41 family peptidase [Gemmatimonadaceae bacterium]MCW5826870.1 S41 family peptidase [Gemmatimonadaceae bacterium]